MKKGETNDSNLIETASISSQKGRRSPENGILRITDSSVTRTSEHIKLNGNDPTNCGCPSKRDVFFDKLLSYLEKQSDVISRCCFKEKNVRNKRSNTDAIFDQELTPCREKNPCEKNPCDKPKKCKEEEKIEQACKPKEECKIVIEVCSCGKDRKFIQPTVSSKSVRSREQISADNTEIDCSGCDKKVDTFFKLADEICTAYLKRCSMNNSTAKPCSEQSAVHGNRRVQEECEDRDWKKDNSLAVHIECQGDREEFAIQPCTCGVKSQAQSEYNLRSNQQEHKSGGYPKHEPVPPTKGCIDVFEERYGQILRDLHSKLIKHYPPEPVQTDKPVQPPQQPNPASDQPTYPPPQQQQGNQNRRTSVPYTPENDENRKSSKSGKGKKKKNK